MIRVEGPERVAAEAKSLTGQYLQPLLERSTTSPLAEEGKWASGPQGDGAQPSSSPAQAGAPPNKKI